VGGAAVFGTRWRESYLVVGVAAVLMLWPSVRRMTESLSVGQLLSLGLHTTSSSWRLVPPLIVAGLATGVLNALLGREAVAGVPPDRAAMGSGANNSARYVGAAVGITLFVIIATHSGSDLAAGRNIAVLVSAILTTLVAVGVALVGR
jgi:hypothetical protein